MDDIYVLESNFKTNVICHVERYIIELTEKTISVTFPLDEHAEYVHIKMTRKEFLDEYFKLLDKLISIGEYQ